MKPSLNHSGRSIQAFTLPELFVVIGTLGLLASVLLSASFTTQYQVQRAACASNLKQIGAAIQVYAVENNDYLPITGWKNPPPTGAGFPWPTYLACRMPTFGSRMIIEGPYGLGLLFFGKEVADPRIFYCPAIQSGMFTYSPYNEPGWPWPSIPPDFALSPNPYVRCGYNYYPQARQTALVNSATYGPITLPVITPQLMVLSSPNPDDPPQNPVRYPAPLKSTDVNPAKSMTTDLLTTTFQNLSHQSGGQPAGAHALFGDGHVLFETVAQNNRLNSLQPFDPKLWDPFSGISSGAASDSDAFRIIMNGWRP